MSQAAPYLRPGGMAEALEALADGDWRIAAGCTDLFPATDRKDLSGPILDITRIPELRGIHRHDAGLTIGAATTWREIARADLPPAMRGLQLAAREVGAQQIQNRGTLGGNLCNASPAADGVPPLLTLDAEVELASIRGRRRLPLAAFITGPRQIARGRDELVTAIHLPARALDGVGAFRKLGARTYLVISIAMVSVRLVVAGGRVAEAAIAVGACGPVATRVPAAEAALLGVAPDPARIGADHVDAVLSPIDDVRADRAYRRDAALTLIRRGVADAMAPVPA